MRLTLRTLLAYLDGVLETADRDDLHQQIEASEFARDLIHRTRDVSRRLRLGTPEPMGGGPIDDPNTMAEYLDNTLPMESVPEFERHCLESDVILAEAAASHHVLAMVLGQPAEVDPETRARIHALPATLREAERLRVDAAHSASSAPPAPPASSPSGVGLGADGATLPDYLRESDRGALLRWMPAIAALLLLSATAYLTFFQRGDSVADASGSEGAAQEAPAANEPGEEQGTPPAEPAKVDDTPAEGGDATTGEASGATEEGGAEPPTETVAAEPEIDPAPNAAPADSPPAETEAPPAPIVVAPVDGAELQPADQPSAAEQAAPEPEPEPSPEPVVESYADAGRFVGPGDCLLTFESAPDVWYRVAVDTPIAFGGRLMTLPTYRGEIALANGLTLALAGLTEASFPEPGEGEGAITLTLRHGRAEIFNRQDEQRTIRLLIGGEESIVELRPKAGISIESDRPYKPGFDVLNVSPPAVTRVYAPKGGLAWTDHGLRVDIESGKQWELTPEGGLAALTDYQGDPGWIGSLRLTPWDEQASPLLARAVNVEREVWPQLREVVDGEAFKEVRALAARCGAAVSHPDPLTASFSEEDQRPVWANNLAELRRLASRSTIEAQRVRRSLVEQHGEVLAADLFRMIRGFGEDEVGLGRDEIERDALGRILEWLGSEALASRVLANLNLEELTGRQGVFRPTDSPTKRRQTIRRLRKLYNNNELRVAAFAG